MTGFDVDWLALREGFDHRARAGAWPAFGLAAHVLRWRAAHAPEAPFSVLDLGCGTGANLRALAARIGGAQRWCLLDHDARVLAALPGAMAAWAQAQGYGLTAADASGAAWRITGGDFSVELVGADCDLARELDAIDVAQFQLVTASALLDLVSEKWLAALVQRARVARTAMLFALSVDGLCTWEPVDAGDAGVLRLFGQHQRRDKGFGPALGPGAVASLGTQLSAAGYTVAQARSDWVIDATRDAAPGRSMLEALVTGMAGAAAEQDPVAAESVLAWQARRLAALSTSRLTVGHVDLWGAPQ